MQRTVTNLLAGTGLAAVLLGAPSLARAADTPDAHVAIAKEAGSKDHPYLFNMLCVKPAMGPTTTKMTAPPERSTWHVEPVKVFDNLYFVGEKEFSAWAITTSAGIILMDTIWDYSIEDEVVDGLKKLGLDPAQIKYAVVSHGHRDHVGGARFLQDHYGTRIIMSPTDWDLVAKSDRVPTKPKPDMVATDGQTLTLGDTTITLVFTPGHTLGTISSLIPVKDHGAPHLVAEWGGTGFNFDHSKKRFAIYAASAKKFGDIAEKAGADVIISNHTNQDGSKMKIPLLAKRGADDPHPYVIGKQATRAYLTVAEQCARAMELNTPE
jgi:metallo-beta-lactamase class B